MKRVFKYLHSIVIIVLCKIYYRKKIKVSLFNSLEGKFKIDIKDNGKIEIGKKIMTRGPVYLNALKDGKLNIGNEVFFNHNCSITAMDSISIGNNCMFGNNIVIVDHNHINTNKELQAYKTKPIIIKNNVWVGANSTILGGITIGDGAIVAANSLVNKSIPDGEVWGGVPAKKIK